ncbi:phosphatase PAP2 family protein [Streptomyces glaucus]|uniref:Phosphatase PAP2 family protein n=1 Tax=Streptomyces glaucus TaxID=284029 RepID=A0ABN3JV68_9ACTN
MAILLPLGLPALLFALITWQVVADGALVGADERLSRALVRPDRLSELLADLGAVQVAVPVLALAAAYVARRGRAGGADRWWRPPVAAALLMALVPALVIPLKELTGRPGPPVMPPGTGYYPSGHTVTAAVAYGSAVAVLLPWLRAAPARRAAVVACVVVNLGVGSGLVRRGYHWPLDVVAGWCLGAVLLTGLVVFLGRGGRPPRGVSCRSRGPAGPSSAATGCAGRRARPPGPATTW